MFCPTLGGLWIVVCNEHDSIDWNIELGEIVKKILITIFLLSAACLSHAGDDSLKLKYCESVSKYAKNIMYSRQHGGQAIDSIKRIERNLKDQEIKGFYLAIIKDAYKQPLWGSEEKKVEAEVEFANEALLICLDTFNS